MFKKHRSHLAGKKWLIIGDSITDRKHHPKTKKYHQWIQEETGCEVLNYGISRTGFTVQETFLERLQRTPIETDYVTVFGGTNDFRLGSKYLGTFQDRHNDSFYGALHLFFQALVKKYPTKQLSAITPLPRWRKEEGEWNSRGETLRQYAEAIKEVTAFYGIPCKDMYSEGGIYAKNPVFRSTYMPDGLHPNSAGHQYFYYKILSFLEGL
ncbi:SGNH/GDSL hydrolase family protein [Siminovitchia sediminis]|uniref:SGNH/GDSL hydrolase family protein n=1 Tax=Siminovitchia sediminis TaxID=1274353 RepID=A0ABW4KE81_9BACI